MDPSGLIGPVATRVHLIDNFETFILHNVPYAHVPPEDIRWGSVQYDGPDAPGIADGKPALQWHFGGVPYPISKAIRIPYSYVRTWDGSNTIVPASIFLGFQDRLTDLILPQPIPFVGSPSSTFADRVKSGPFGAFSNPFWGSDAALLASEAIGLVTRSIWRHPSAGHTFDNFIESELSLSAERFAALSAFPTPVDFEGLAQDNDSQNVFQYMPSLVANDPSVYGRLVHWYFGGKAYSLTKVMRIWLDTNYSEKAAQQSFVQAAADQRAQQIATQQVAAASAAVEPKQAEEHQHAEKQPTGDVEKDPGHAALQTANERHIRRIAALKTRVGSAVAAPAQRVAHGLVAADPQGFALFIGYGGGLGGDG